MNDPTRYEVAATHKDGRSWLIGYTPRLSRPGLLAAMQRHGQLVIERLEIDEKDKLTWAMRPRIHSTIGRWTIGFTGRTQRDAKIADREHPRFGLYGTGRPFIAGAIHLSAEAEAAARWQSRHGLDGSKGTALPDKLSVAVVREIELNPEWFRVAVKEAATELRVMRLEAA